MARPWNDHSLWKLEIVHGGSLPNELHPDWEYNECGRVMPKTKKASRPRAKPYCFVSYSSREPHVNMLFPCLWIALSPSFDLRLTPSALESGASQRSRILELIEGCSFAIVVLDGLRPNVTYEYGLLDAHEKPVILLKEKTATVDIKSLIGDAVGLAVGTPALNIDSHFSDIKDINHVEWSRQDPAAAIRIILQEYRKKKSKIDGYVEIAEPELWLT
jgi:hypothetical protein